ncbi:hypothetical protein C7H85_15210 [Zobellella endophytica]|uniref:DNA polymerase III subunit psi n=1 Tax=Zobellella endophytica TaxID=2116700 RepID=A0A2P7R1J5_9GAMM|nr:hypothetical protein [Zobellella endophytica]PSJ44093.1 hypothetical protein C7H85_15210 [Zobellella endophytica]
MTPLQSQLWHLLELPAWRCAHPERLPHAPRPEAGPAALCIVVGQGRTLPETLLADIARALPFAEERIRVMDEAAWLAAEQPVAGALLGFHLTTAPGAFLWHGGLPLTARHKRELWSRLCQLFTAD